jgi:hypothetical protein
MSLSENSISEDGGNCETFQTMQQLIVRGPRNSDRIRPLIPGETFLVDSAQKPDRYVIDFEDFTEVRAREWPDLFTILEQRVKPFRSKANRDRVREVWWQFGEVRLNLRDTQVTYGGLLDLRVALPNTRIRK